MTGALASDFASRVLPSAAALAAAAAMRRALRASVATMARVRQWRPPLEAREENKCTTTSGLECISVNCSI